MNTKPQTELREFHQFIGDKVTNGGASLSPEEVLDEWRTLHPDSAMADEDVAAIQEAIDDMERGDKGIMFEQFDQDFRSRHHLPANP